MLRSASCHITNVLSGHVYCGVCGLLSSRKKGLPVMYNIPRCSIEGDQLSLWSTCSYLLVAGSSLDSIWNLIDSELYPCITAVNQVFMPSTSDSSHDL